MLAAALLLAPDGGLLAQDFTLGTARTVPEPKPGLPVYDYAPDGHYTVMRVGGSLMMFWPGHDSYRTRPAAKR